MYLTPNLYAFRNLTKNIKLQIILYFSWSTVNYGENQIFLNHCISKNEHL